MAQHTIPPSGAIFQKLGIMDRKQSAGDLCNLFSLFAIYLTENPFIPDEEKDQIGSFCKYFIALLNDLDVSL